MAELSARPGDAQALKACIAAQKSGVQLKFVAADPKNPFGTPSVSQAVPEQPTLAEPNAEASNLAGAIALLASGVIESPAAAVAAPLLLPLPLHCVFARAARALGPHLWTHAAAQNRERSGDVTA